jgi:hypothetical protein
MLIDFNRVVSSICGCPCKVTTYVDVYQDAKTKLVMETEHGIFEHTFDMRRTDSWRPNSNPFTEFIWWYNKQINL